MSSRWIIGFMLLVLSTPNVYGQTSVLDELYGEAVHRYFARDYSAADELLTRAIENGSRDPRVFYYRGLARAAYGGDPLVDFEEGARLEVSGRIGVNVGQSLARIQGHHRVQIEKARQDARLLALQQRERARQAVPTPPPAVLEPLRIDPAALSDPFESGTRSEEADVVPTPVPTPSDSVEPDDSSTDPFADEALSDPAATSPESLDEPAEVDLFDSPDPFGADDIPSEPSDSPFDDPFSN
jgi:hypothetical protein